MQVAPYVDEGLLGGIFGKLRITKDAVYVYFDGRAWFWLRCNAKTDAPDDRWLSIAETFEFLPVEG